MLNSSLNPIRSTKINECIMRRRARNLRAKVKALLPVQTCCKHDQRNRCVYQIQANEKCWNNLGLKNTNWTISKQKQNRYYFQNPPVINQHQRFQKLTKTEIEQIKQDRLYYLGEENLADFEQFLQGKKNNNQLDQVSQSLIVKTFQHLFKGRCAQFFSNQRRNTQLSQTLTPQFSSLSPFITNRSKTIKKATTQQKAKNFQDRRRVILLQQKSKILMDKVRLNMRFERAQNKLKELNLKKQDYFETKRQNKQLQIKRVTSRRRNYHKRGEIKQIQQKLRKTFLNRVSKTANEFSRIYKNDVQKFQS